MSPRAATVAAPPVQAVQVPAGELKTASAWAARIVPTRPAPPILGGVMIDRDADGHLTLAAFDYETSGRIVLDGADGDLPTPLLVHGRFLVVEAESREDAINQAIARHGRRFNHMGNPSWALTRAQRVAIEYGEPEFLGGSA